MVISENFNSTSEVIQSRASVMIGQLEELFSDYRAAVERTNLVAAIDKAILNSTFSSDDVFRVIVQQCLSRTGCTHGQIVSYRRNRLRVVASSDESKIGVELPLTGSFCGKAILEKATQYCKVAKDLHEGNHVTFHDETRSEMAVLIKLEHSGRILGILSLEREREGEFEKSAIDFAEILAGQAAIAIEHSDTWSSIRMLSEMSSYLLSGKMTLAQSLDKILGSILESLDFEYGQIVRLLGEEFVILASSLPGDTGLRFGRDSVCGQHILDNKSKEILEIPNIQDSPYGDRYLGLHELHGAEMQSELIVPLVDYRNRVVGALNIESTRVSAFSALDLHLVGVIGSLIANAISAALSRRKMLDETRMDSARLALTQLGGVAQNFLHRFSNCIGDARGRVIELRDNLPNEPIPTLRKGMTPGNFIQTIIDEIDLGGEAIEDFADRFNPDKKTFQNQALNLEVIARGVMEKVKNKPANSHIRFKFESHIPSGDTITGGQVYGKPECWLSDQINEVIENFLNNSVDAINGHGQDFQDGLVLVSVSLPDPFRACVKVTDNGIGISKNHEPQIFDFGFTTKGRIGQGGFGLWFCNWYVMMRGGTINHHTEPGRGTTFEIMLPTLIGESEAVLSNDTGGTNEAAHFSD